MTDCLFCKIREGEVPSHKVYEDEKTYAFLTIEPNSKGHTLIIPKEHADDLSVGSEESAIDIIKTARKIAPKIMKALGATGYNLGMNHGADAGQLVFHTHLHLIPRYAGEPRNFEKMEVSDEELREVAEEIRKEMADVETLK